MINAAQKLIGNIEPARSLAISLTQKLISIPSLSGQEREVVGYLENRLPRLGFGKVFHDDYGSLIAEKIIGNGTGPKLVLSGHLDTVEAERERWDYNPFAAEIVGNEKIIGRGASDMKGADAAMITAISFLKDLPDFLNGKIYFVGTVAEERFEGIAFKEALKEINPNFVIIGEATNGKINIGQRGRAEVVIDVPGITGHSAHPEVAVNAFLEMCRVGIALEDNYKPEKHPLLGPRIMVFTDNQIPMGGNSKIPARSLATLDVRLLPGDTPETIFGLINEAIQERREARKKLRENFPSLGEISLKLADDILELYTGKKLKQSKFFPAWEVGRDDPIVQAAIIGLKNFGLEPKLGSWSFCTDGSAIPMLEVETGKKIPIIGFGPSQEDKAHIDNEFIMIADMEKAIRGYWGILFELLRQN